MKSKNIVRIFALVMVISVIGTISAFSQSRSLRVGAAKVDITPPVRPGYEPSGKYDHEKLYIRAIVLDNGETRAALIGADLNNLYEEVWLSSTPMIAEKLNCPVGNIIMSPTHTHSGRTAGPPPEGGQNPANDTEFVVNAIMDAIEQAKAELQPAKVGYGEGKAYLNVNRDVIGKETRLWTQAANLEGPSDKTLAIVMFTDLKGFPIAGYMNYAMHPVTAYQSGITSADFPGAACRYVEKAFKDDMVMLFSQGASGDQNPRWLRPGTNALASKSGVPISGFELVREEVEAPLRAGEGHGSLDPVVAENLERWIDAMGLVLGEEAIRVMTNIDELQSDIRILGIQEVKSLPGRKRTNTGREGMPGTYEDGPDVDLRFGFLGIGDIAITTVNAEIYNIIAQQVKEKSSMNNTFMVTIGPGKANSGYIIPDSDYGKQTFQVLNNKIKPGYAEQIIINTLVEYIDMYNSGLNKTARTTD
jgi:hypothetical protein